VSYLLDSISFDIWAEEYDQFIQRNSKGYPFEGYYDVLNYMYHLIGNKQSSKILDIGVGTGILTYQLYTDGAAIYGIDFSKKMLEIAQAKMPKAQFVKWDFNFGLPPEFECNKYDYIISSYALHHLDTIKKIETIKQLQNVLGIGGKIVIGDIAFETIEELLKCKNENKDNWDDEEIYIIANEITRKLKTNGISANYKQISSCAGVLEILQSC
jgi:putative AdoMet-dependent methyltransferase